MKFDMRPAVILQKIPKISLYVLAFLLPLWFLLITQDALNVQKQALLVVLVVVALMVWLFNTISAGALSFRASWLHVGVLAVLVTSTLATATSVWRYGSFWGWPLSVTDSLLTLLLFGLLYFLFSQVIESIEELPKFFLTLIVSSVIAGVYAVFQLYQIFILSPIASTKIATFNTIGSAGSVAILVAVLLPFAVTMAFVLKGWLRWSFGACAIALLFILMLINFHNAWLVSAVSFGIMVAFGMWNLKRKPEYIWLSSCTALLVISLLFLFIRISLPGAPALPLEVSPNLSAELSILKSTIWQSPVLGTGPGTFIFDYAKYHKPSLNQTIFWSTRFSVGASAVLDWFVTTGILGGLALVALLGSALFFAGKLLYQSKGDGVSLMIGLAVVASLVGVVLSQAIYYSNFVLLFVFWILLASLSIFTAKPKRLISIAPPSSLSIVFSSVFLLVLILGVGLLFVGGQKYVAEVQYAKGSASFAVGDNQNAIYSILSAANTNPSVDMYWRDLAQLYLLQFNQLTNDKSLSDDQRKQQTQTAVSNAVTAANQAIIISPANVENWNVRGFIYRNLVGIEGADALAVDSYTRASSLEPASPFIYTELGRVYFLKAQNSKGSDQKDALASALENLNKAIELKADYPPAHYLTALVYGLQGKVDDEIAKLEKTKEIAPNDIGVAFQLGVIYYQKGDWNNAQEELERAKALNADYANGRYMLGLVYSKQGKVSQSIDEFTKVLQLNPDNAEVKQILANLNAGKPPLDGLSQSQPLIFENPPEINQKTGK